jgi:hypothetical protein
MQKDMQKTNLLMNHKAVGNIFIGISAAAFAGILALLQLKDLDVFLMIFMGCFTVVMPISLIIGVTSSYSDIKSIRPKESYLSFTIFTALLVLFIAFIGITCLLFHFSIVVGILFVVITILSVTIYMNQLEW